MRIVVLIGLWFATIFMSIWAAVLFSDLTALAVVVLLGFAAAIDKLWEGFRGTPED